MSTYSIKWQEDSRTLVLILDGFWPEGDVIKFKDDLICSISQAHGKPFDLIADLSNFPPQAGTVVELQAEWAELLTRGGMRRLVIVAAGALSRMQVKRASPEVAPIFVSNMADALASLTVQVDHAA